MNVNCNDCMNNIKKYNNLDNKFIKKLYKIKEKDLKIKKLKNKEHQKVYMINNNIKLNYINVIRKIKIILKQRQN